MPPLVVDFTGVQDGMVAIPEGVYPVQVNDCTVETAAGSKAQYVKFQFVVIDGEYAGSLLYYNNSLLKQALWKLKQTLRALCGWSAEDMSGPIQFDESDLLGRRALASVTAKVYEGKNRNNVEELRPLDDATLGPAGEAGPASSEEPF